MTTTLTLDLASTTGWAIRHQGHIESGTWDITPRRGDSPGMRYVNLRTRLNTMLVAFPDLRIVYYEQAHHRGGAATEYAIGCITLVQAWCAEHGIEHGARHTATIKRSATGKGNAGKGEVIEAMRRAGHKPADDNEADALALMYLVVSEMGCLS